MLSTKTLKTVHKFLGRPPLASLKVTGNTPCFAERYICDKLRGTLPSLDDQVIVVHFSGAPVFQDTAQGEVFTSHSSMSSILPIGKPTHFHIAGVIDFAVIYIDNNDLPGTQKILSLLHEFDALKSFPDPLLSALIQQLFNWELLPFSNAYRPGGQTNRPYCNTLMDAFFSHLGYLASKDSKPNFESGSHQLHRVHDLIEYIQSHLSKDLSAETLSDLLGLSASHLRKIFLTTTGVTLHQYILERRLRRAYELILNTDFSIARIAQETGFSSQSHLTSCFKNFYSVPPAKFRRELKNKL